MTGGYIRPTAFLGDQTFATPPGLGPPQKAMQVIVVGMALAISPTNAMATTRDDPREALRATSQWTNSGTILDAVGAERGFADAVTEVRRRSGLTWEQLASLFGVDRRSVHLWASGRPMNAVNAERLNRILAVLRRVDRGTPSATRAWLYSPTSQGVLPLELLRQGNFDRIATPTVSAAASRPAPLSEAASRTRAPRPPHELIAAHQDRAHIETGKLITAVPLEVSNSK